MGFTTEFEFMLPKGYVDEDGALHKTRRDAAVHGRR